MERRVSIILLAAVVATMVASPTSTTTMVYASHHSSGSGSDSSSGSNGSSDKSSDKSGSGGNKPSEQPSTLTGGSNTNPPSNPQPPYNPSQPNIQGPTNPPIIPNTQQPSPTNQCTGKDVNSCPIPQGENLGTNCPPNATVVDGRCTLQGNPFPVNCPGGGVVYGLNAKCPPIHECKGGEIFVLDHKTCELNKDCFIVRNGIDTQRVVCVHSKTVVHNIHTTTIQQVPALAANANDINLMLVTTCTADFNIISSHQARQHCVIPQ
jgi:hypothetical protein